MQVHAARAPHTPSGPRLRCAGTQQGGSVSIMLSDKAAQLIADRGVMGKVEAEANLVVLNVRLGLYLLPYCTFTFSWGWRS